MKVGRKPSPANLKKNMCGVKLPQWLLDWTAAQPESRAVLIEDALKKVHNLETPEPEEQENLEKDNENLQTND